MLGSLSATSILTATSLVTTLTAKPAQAAQFCQCPIYVNNRFQLQPPYVWAAKDYGAVLARNGFSQIASPQPGAVVVMQSSFPGADTTYGHIGVIETVDTNGKIKVRGTNQDARYGYSVGSEFNCNNVSVIGFGTSVNGRRDISFWVRGQSNPKPVTQQGFNPVNFSAWVMSSNGITLRNSPRLADRSNQAVGYRQTLSFDGWAYGETVADLQLGTPDARWYKLAGQNLWVPSAYVNGNAPNSRPMP